MDPSVHQINIRNGDLCNNCCVCLLNSKPHCGKGKVHKEAIKYFEKDLKENQTPQTPKLPRKYSKEKDILKSEVEKFKVNEDFYKINLPTIDKTKSKRCILI